MSKKRKKTNDVSKKPESLKNVLKRRKQG